jgi:osmoprotectant transport system substrate-binding protein
MDDDKHFFPIYNAALTIPQDISSKYPKIAEIIAPITKKLTTEALQKINARVDVDGLTPAEAATEWLKSESVFK